MKQLIIYLKGDVYMFESFNGFFAGNKLDVQSSETEEEVLQLNVEFITPNEYQPRHEFDEEKINELAQTLHTHGMIQPIVVRKKAEEAYELIAGERRLRAAKQLGWKTISAIVRNMTDTETASIALIENIQREQLNVIEEAKAYEQLLKMHSLTQEALAQRLGKSQSTIANRIRLLNLSDPIKAALSNRNITERHARALMKIKDEEQQLKFLDYIMQNELNVRETDELIKNYLSKPDKKEDKRPPKRKIVSKDVRIATNTIKKSLQMIADTGIDVQSEEEDFDDYYKITIKVKKNK